MDDTSSSSPSEWGSTQQKPRSSASLSTSRQLSEPTGNISREPDVQSFYAQYAAMPRHHPRSTSSQTEFNPSMDTYAVRHSMGYTSSFGMENVAASLPSLHASATGYPVSQTALLSQQFPGRSYAHQQPTQFQALDHPPNYATMEMQQRYVAQYSAQMYPPYPIYPQQQHTNPSTYPPFVYTSPHALPQAIGSEGEGIAAAQIYPQFSPARPSQPGLYDRDAGNRTRDSASMRAMSASTGTDASKNEDTTSMDYSRGPPRKPRQSGHALWVGNLPLGTTIVDMKDHFSRGATHEIESIKLIAKSNCAFVNYRTEAACLAAMTRFHDLRLHGNRLVCRLRRSSTITSSAEGSSNTLSTSRDPSEQPAEETSPMIDNELVARRPISTRFFVLKSLTVQDLEACVRHGIWATQVHNETALNDAFEHAENVFLFFSANKSGEYFGYARMSSTISASTSEVQSFNLAENLAVDTEVTPSLTRVRSSAHTSSLEPSPGDIPTEATQWAPRGRIIDDSARGTIFWEADREDALDITNADRTLDADNAAFEAPNRATNEQAVIVTSTPQRISSLTRAGNSTGSGEEIVEPLSGNAFRVEWLTTRRVPFYKTRGLRNPWNANREVKIARDGTELETEVGKTLLALFGGRPVQ